MRLSILTAMTASALALAVPVVLPIAQAQAAMPVFDVTNYGQNLLQAARALEQINNQIRSLQNEAAIIQQAARHLEKIDFPQLQQMTSALDRIDQLMAKADGINFKVGELDARFEALFPDAFSSALKSDQRLAAAKIRLDEAMRGYKQSMAVQSEVVANVQEDSKLLSDLVARSQGAMGNLQAQQATNQLLALSAKQQFQLQNLMAAEFRSQAAERARATQAQAEGQAATRRFLGDGKAYDPAGSK